LRVYIDREGGVDLEACATASQRLREVVDATETEILYDHMEVSSPGLDRIIKTEKDLLRFTGYKVKVKTLKAYSGPRKIIGILKGFSAKEISIQDQEQNLLNIPRDMITVIRLHPDL
jgi:ribosome maturation factor RimP